LDVRFFMSKSDKESGEGKMGRESTTIKKKPLAKQPKEKKPNGRPPKFPTVPDIQIKIDEYFDECDAKEKPYTIAGLAYHLDMTRQGLCEYSAKDDFSDIIKSAKLRVERSVEERLFSNSATGCIFWLKNHAGYRDKTENDVKLQGEVKHIHDLTEAELVAIATGRSN